MGSPKPPGLRNYETFLETVDIPTNKPYIILFLVLSGIILYIGVGLIGLFPSPPETGSAQIGHVGSLCIQ